jgi:nucleotide-binding universal stress UspA family protein
MNILLAVDGSKNSLNAVSSLIEHVNWFAEAPAVHLLYVHLPVPKVGGFGGGPSKSMLEKYYQEEGEECLTKARRLLDKAKVDYDDAILVGPVAETICKYAAQKKCDLIVMGTRGQSSAVNLVVGSVATKVLHAATVPVMLVK